MLKPGWIGTLLKLMLAVTGIFDVLIVFRFRSSIVMSMTSPIKERLVSLLY